MTRWARFAVLVASATACAAGAGDPDRPTTTISDDGSSSAAVSTTGDASGSADDGPGACVPGQQIACPCPGGGEGAQACNAEGTGYEMCICPGADSGSDAGEPTTAATTSESEGEGGSTDTSEACPPDLECDACVQCALENDCKEQYSACTSDPVCAESSNCVFDCGFTPACGLQCAPENGGEASQLYNETVQCVMMICQCV